MNGEDLLYLRGQVNGISERVSELADRQDLALDTAQRRADYVLTEVVRRLAGIARAQGAELQPRLKVIAGGAESATAPAGHLRAVAGGAS